MKIKRDRCTTCGGSGRVTLWVNNGELNENNEHIFNMKFEDCKQCDGIGYTEYTVFNKNEAEQILKHCGIEVIEEV
jgi:hypothetical protein